MIKNSPEDRRRTAYAIEAQVGSSVGWLGGEEQSQICAIFKDPDQYMNGSDLHFRAILLLIQTSSYPSFDIASMRIPKKDSFLRRAGVYIKGM